MIRNHGLWVQINGEYFFVLIQNERVFNFFQINNGMSKTKWKHWTGFYFLPSFNTQQAEAGDADGDCERLHKNVFQGDP